MTHGGSTGRDAAIERFAATLREVRTAAGTPSFREMSGRSKAISHTTLHEAAQGHRLPSWPTTVEFVKACDADPAGLRRQWEDANRLVRAEATDGTPDGEAVSAASSDAPAGRPGRRRSGLLLAGAAVTALAVGVTVAAVVANGDDDPAAGGSPGPSGRPAALTAADCPVAQTNPPPAPPTHRGDRSEFVADVTLPDCTKVEPGGTVRKVWRLKNVGSRTWDGYELRRVDLPQRGDQCQTITDVPVPRTAPGQLVDIGVDITAPPEPTFCFVRFKMIDASGHLAFRGSRPINFQLVVR